MVGWTVLTYYSHRHTHILIGTRLSTFIPSELDNNKLTSVSKDWMYNLTSLHTLSLANNSIAVIESDSWDFVLGLHTL